MNFGPIVARFNLAIFLIKRITARAGGRERACSKIPPNIYGLIHFGRMLTFIYLKFLRAYHLLFGA